HLLLPPAATLFPYTTLFRSRAHTSPEVKLMVVAAGVWKKKRDDLKTKRNSLFSVYTRDPQNISLAREIKALDDEIADCTQHVERSEEHTSELQSRSDLVCRL